MFVFKKILSSFVLPPGCLILIILVYSIFLFKRRKKEAIFLMSLSFILYITSCNFLAKYIICKIEKNICDNSVIFGDVIVVLGGDVSLVKDKLLDIYLPGVYSLERVFAAYRLHKKTKLPIILSGGSVFGSSSFADISKIFLIGLGINEKYIFVDSTSRDTYENVINSIKIMKANGFNKPIVVSDSLHILRAIKIFKRKNIEASYYPSSYMCSSFSLMDFLPGDMHYTRTLLYEVVGNIWYLLLY